MARQTAAIEAREQLQNAIHPLHGLLGHAMSLWLNSSIVAKPAVTLWLTAPVNREAAVGLASRQIANSLTEQCGHKTFQISGFWAVNRQTGNFDLNF